MRRYRKLRTRFVHGFVCVSVYLNDAGAKDDDSLKSVFRTSTGIGVGKVTARECAMMLGDLQAHSSFVLINIVEPVQSII